MPALMLRSRAHEPDGIELVRELDETLGTAEHGALSHVLWLSVRRAAAWAEMHVSARASALAQVGSEVRALVERARHQCPDLTDALHVFGALLAAPGAIETKALADACTAVSRWAGDHGLIRTAVMFMETAAAVDFANAVRAMDAGLVCQRLGGSELRTRAEQWHQRAFGLARAATCGRKLLEVRALLAYGNWAAEVEEYALARKCYAGAERRARRCQRWTYCAVAWHNMLALLLATGGTLEEAERLVRAALECYPASDRRIPRLVHDFAALLNRKYCYEEAFALLEKLSERVREPELRLLCLSSLAWAAGGARRRDAFESALAAALPLLELHRDFAAKALVQFAEGALLLEDSAQAAKYASRARVFADQHGDREACLATVDLLERVAAGAPPSPSKNAGCTETSELLRRALIEPKRRRREFRGRVEREEKLDTGAAAAAPAAALPAQRMRPLPSMPNWPLWEGEETLAGYEVLRETATATDSAGISGLPLTLWTALRRVHSWGASLVCGVNTTREAISPAPRRPRVASLQDALEVFGAFPHVSSEPDLGMVADACDRVARWASDQGCLRTALLFIEAAARAEPEDALRAMDAGEMCQRVGGPALTARAEQWLRRALALARAAKRGRTLLCIRAHLALGNWARDSGDHASARIFYDKGSRRAKNHGRGTYYARCRHNVLALLLSTGGTLEEGVVLAQAAVDHYPRSDARIPRLGHDYGALLVRNGIYTSAFALLQHVPERLDEPRLRLLCHSTLAWAASGAGRHAAYQAASRSALTLALDHPDFAAHALVQLAQAARLARDTERAQRHARAAAALAAHRSDGEVLRTARALLEELKRGVPPVPPRELPSHSRFSVLQRTLAARLARGSVRR